MCIYEGPSPTCTAKTGFTGIGAAAQKALLDKHNELRSKVALGQQSGQPAAADMNKLVWNAELATIAQRLADQCEFAHDKVRTKLDGTSSGQNLYIGSTSNLEDQATLEAKVGNGVQAWYDEVTDPGFTSSSINPFVFSSGTGHYTAVVWAKTTEVGCGAVYYTESPWNRYLLVCNYAVAGNLQGGTMYTAGTACTACPSGTTCEAATGLCKK